MRNPNVTKSRSCLNNLYWNEYYQNGNKIWAMYRPVQQTYTCSKLVIETIGKGVKYVQSSK